MNKKLNQIFGKSGYNETKEDILLKILERILLTNPKNLKKEFKKESCKIFGGKIEESFGIKRINGWLWRGFSEKEAKEKISKSQSLTTRQAFIDRYGEKEGEEKYQKFANNLGFSLEKCIKKYGKEEGQKKFEEYSLKESISHTKERMIKKHGKEKYKKMLGKSTKGLLEFSRNLKNTPEKNSKKIEYYLIKGFSEEEARSIIKESQRTFSLEKCIGKYGKKEGTKKWKKRQEKWQKSLKNKPKEEIERINKSKGITKEKYIEKYGKEEGIKKYESWRDNFVKRTKIPYSKISQELFWNIHKNVKNKFKEIFFAELNKEFKIKTKNHNRFLDFYIKDNKSIEFDGDYWHQNSNSFARDTEIKEVNKNIEILRIKEKDYNQNKKRILQDCLIFLK